MSISESLGVRRTVEVSGAGTIEYRESGSGAPLVFAHGVGVNGDLWRRVAPPLAAGGRRCIVPDLPLGGHSIPLSQAPDMSLPGLADILAGFVEALDLDDVTLVANDTGGAITQAYIGRRPERIARLVLTSCDAFDRYPPPAVAYLKPLARVPGGLWTLGHAVRFKAVQRLPIAYGWATHRPIEPRVMASYTTGVRTDAGVRADLARVLKGARKSDMQAASRSVANFDRPALVAWAADDLFFPVEHGRALADLMPNARFELIRNSRTFVPEDQPGELVRLIA
ncbi:MAG TPA: alpha/beta hydrolase [Thermoleophilaceae bacterium]